MNKPRTGLVILGGEYPGSATMGKLLGQVDVVVAADSGYDNALALGIAVDAIVGDFDSVRAPLPKPDGAGPAVVAWPRDKDWSDAELAIQYARQQGCGRIFLAGGGGGRIDHLLAIYALFQKQGSPDRWYTRYDELVIIRQYLGMPIRKGSVVSFFPMGNEPCQARSRGLHWPLDGLRWSNGDCGLSNRLDAERLDLWVDSGRLLMVRAMDDGDEPLGPDS